MSVFLCVHMRESVCVFGLVWVVWVCLCVCVCVCLCVCGCGWVCLCVCMIYICPIGLLIWPRCDGVVGLNAPFLANYNLDVCQNRNENNFLILFFYFVLTFCFNLDLQKKTQKFFDFLNSNLMGLTQQISQTSLNWVSIQYFKKSPHLRSITYIQIMVNLDLYLIFVSKNAMVLL
jgi:hypothetical protein